MDEITIETSIVKITAIKITNLCATTAALLCSQAAISASPLNPNPADAHSNKLVSCREFARPFFIEKKPTQCQSLEGCVKRLTPHLCALNTPEYCTQNHQWQPLSNLLDLPQDAIITRITPEKMPANGSPTTAVCAYYRLSLKEEHRDH